MLNGVNLGKHDRAVNAILIDLSQRGAMEESMVERAMESLKVAAKAKVEHALVLAPGDQTSDAQMLRAIEQTHATSPDAAIVIHPPPNTPIDRDRRWVMLVERSTPMHKDVRLSLRLPPPTGTR